jgi:hypothetical protein
MFAELIIELAVVELAEDEAVAFSVLGVELKLPLTAGVSAIGVFSEFGMLMVVAGVVMLMGTGAEAVIAG